MHSLQFHPRRTRVSSRPKVVDWPAPPKLGNASASPSSGEIERCRAEIARLLPLWPHELADMSPRGRAHVIATLERELRSERRRGLAGHWTYNLARHAQLLRAYRAETAALRVLRRDKED